MKKHFNLYTLILSLLFAALTITGCANLFDENETPITLTVTFKANYEGSTYEDDTQVVPVGKEFTLKKNTFSRPGYVFGGWSKDSTATTSSYQDGGNATFTESTILYAVWLASTSTITFNGNGGTVSGDGTTTSYTQEMTTKVPTALTPNKFKRIGYLFAGWAEDKDASEPLYKDGVTYTPSGSVTLYAIWAEIKDTYEIHYMNGETEVTEDASFWADGYSLPKTYTVDTNSESPTYGQVTSTVTLPALANIKTTSKYFSGWYKDSNFAGTSWTEVSGVAAGDLTFYVKWTDTGLYVAGTGHTVVSADGSDTYTGDDAGSIAHPYATLQTAINKIQDAPTLDWTINIDGNVSGNTEITTKNVKSIIILGVTSSSSDILTGSSGSTISVVGATKVVLQNIKITGGTGKTSEEGTVGGGIYISDAGATVMLNSSVLITGNTATKGGGIYIGGGTATLNGGAIKGNTATSCGGGVYIAAGSFTLSSGDIGVDGEANTAIEGGGVYNSGIFTMTGGTITGNKANKSGQTKGRGGGIYNNASLSITGGYIGTGKTAPITGTNCANKASLGGGIYNSESATQLSLSSCSVTCNYAGDGGGVYTKVTWSDSNNCVSGNGAGEDGEADVTIDTGS